MVISSREWMDDAYCATDPIVHAEQLLGYDRFHDSTIPAEVQKYCNKFCSVVNECRNYAIDITYTENDTVTETRMQRLQMAHGIWGGTSPKQRGKIVQGRKANQAKILLLVEQMKAQSQVLNNHTEVPKDVPA